MNEIASVNSGIPTTIEDLSKFVLVGREKMTAVRAEIRAIDRLGLAEEVRRQKLEEAQMISEAVLDAEVKIGTLTVQIPKATSASGNQYTDKWKNDSGVVNPKPKSETIKDLGFTPKQVERFEKLAKNPELVEQAKAEARENDDVVSRSLVLEKIKNMEREERRTEIIESLEKIAVQEVKVAQGVYDAIVIDPPWDMQKIERNERPNQMEFDYPTMSEDELEELDIPTADDCHVWLWTTQKYLPMAFRLLDKWGLRYVCCFAWHKPGGFQPFGLPQYNCEFALYARKGSPSFIDTKAFPTCFEATRGAHSEKPALFYDMIRRVTAGRRLDMFSRRQIEGFDSYGNEVDWT